MTLDLKLLPTWSDLAELDAAVEALGRLAHLARPEALLASQLDRLLPSDALTTHEWACSVRRIRTADGGTTPFRPELTPYVRRIHETCDDPAYTIVAASGPGRSGKTLGFENHLGKRLDRGPWTPTLWLMQSNDDLDDYVEDRIEPFLEDHPWIAAKLGTSPKDRTRRRKRFDGQILRFMAASLRALRGKAYPLIIGDEIDAWNKRVVKALKTLLRSRQREFGSIAKILLASHPDIGPLDGIAALVADGTDERWYWDCPHCGEPSSPAQGARHRMTVKLPDLAGVPRDEVLDLVERTAALTCPHCGHDVTNEQRLEITQGGRWVGRGEEPVAGGKRGRLLPNDTAGFQIHGFMSPFATIGELAREFVAARLNYEESPNRDETALREVTTKALGECYRSPRDDAEPATWQLLKSRLSVPGFRLKTVPAGVRYLVAFIDVQKNRFEVRVLGFDEGLQSWLVDAFAIKQWPGFVDLAPFERAADWRVLKPAVLDQRYRVVTPPGEPAAEMGIAKTSVDVGGGSGRSGKPVDPNAPPPSSTLNARRWAADMLARERVPLWRIMLAKGDAYATGDLVQKPRPVLFDEAGRPLPVQVYERTVNVSALKDIVAERLRVEVPGPGFCNVPEDVPDSVFRELTAETKIAGQWVRRGANETFDGYVGCEAVRITLEPTLAKVDWTRPPAWARPQPVAPAAAGGAETSKPVSFAARLAALNNE